MATIFAEYDPPEGEDSEWRSARFIQDYAIKRGFENVEIVAAVLAWGTAAAGVWPNPDWRHVDALRKIYATATARWSGKFWKRLALKRVAAMAKPFARGESE